MLQSWAGQTALVEVPYITGVCVWHFCSVEGRYGEFRTHIIKGCVFCGQCSLGLAFNVSMQITAPVLMLSGFGAVI